jgi:hypothetical protein
MSEQRQRDVPGGRLPNAAYTSARWRIKELTPDFQLEDVWELPGEGRREDLPRLVELVCRMDPGRDAPWGLTKALWALRWKLGEVFGWDDDDGGLDARVPRVRDRLPEDLRATDPPAFATLPFTSLYLTDDEFAAEVANRTMHGVMHLGWVPSAQDPEVYRVQMAVLVKPNGWKGKAYMLAIRPFRHFIVYPAMMRQGRALWERAQA